VNPPTISHNVELRTAVATTIASDFYRRRGIAVLSFQYVPKGYFTSEAFAERLHERNEMKRLHVPKRSEVALRAGEDVKCRCRGVK
jgi:hypothetical protein